MSAGEYQGETFLAAQRRQVCDPAQAAAVETPIGIPYWDKDAPLSLAPPTLLVRPDSVID